MLVTAVHVALLTLAVMAVAVGALDDTGGAAGALVMAVAGLGLAHVHGQEDHEGGKKEQGALHDEIGL